MGSCVLVPMLAGLLIGLILGIAFGYGIREFLSRHRRKVERLRYQEKYMGKLDKGSH